MNIKIQPKRYNHTSINKEYPSNFVNETPIKEEKTKLTHPYKIVQCETNIEGICIIQKKIKHHESYNLEVEFDFPHVNLCFWLNGMGISRSQHPTGLAKRKMQTNQNNSWCMPPFRGEYIVPKQKKETQYIQMFFTKLFFNKLVDENHRTLYNMAKGLNQKIYTPLADRPLSITFEMKQTINDILNCTYQGHLKKLYLESKVIELFLLQLEQKKQQKKEHTVKKRDRDKIYEAKKVLDNQYLDPPTIPELAKMVLLNSFKLKKGFKKLFSTTVFQYGQNLRMLHAKELLLNKNQTVTEVAYALGYSYPQHFTVAFKKHFNCLPSKVKN